MPMTPAPFPRAILLFLIAGLLALGLTAPARAQSCTFSASNIVLGPVDVLGSSPTTATGNIAVNCSTFLGLLTSITVTIELGDGSAGLFGSLRRLGGPSGSSLAYDLYQNPTHTTIFGGSQGTHGGQPVVLTGTCRSMPASPARKTRPFRVPTARHFRVSRWMSAPRQGPAACWDATRA